MASYRFPTQQHLAVLTAIRFGAVRSDRPFRVHGTLVSRFFIGSLDVTSAVVTIRKHRLVRTLGFRPTLTAKGEAFFAAADVQVAA